MQIFPYEGLLLTNCFSSQAASGCLLRRQSCRSIVLQSHIRPLDQPWQDWLTLPLQLVMVSSHPKRGVEDTVRPLIHATCSFLAPLHCDAMLHLFSMLLNAPI